MPKRILITTLGSLGDIHPYMAIALGVQARGHRAVIATSEMYRAKIEAAGIGFHPVRPDISPGDTGLLKIVMEERKGGEYLLRRLIFPRVRESYEDLMSAVAGADLLITHVVTFAGPLVAEKTGLPWISTVLAPLSFFSYHDSPVLASALLKVREWSPAVNATINRIARYTTRSWGDRVQQLREEIGLPRGREPIFEALHSPQFVLALFSPILAAPQPDWPPQTRVTGFPFYDYQEHGAGMPTALCDFLDAGPPPIVFTLGSSAVMDAGQFYVESAKAARQLGTRAVLLIGKDERNLPATPLPDGVVAFEYAPYSSLFPRAAAVVHQGGVGTTSQALRAGRPMLVMPYAHDQPDNAARVKRLGVARIINRYKYTAARAAAELRQLLENQQYRSNAEAIGSRVRAEDGVGAACDVIEERLSRLTWP
jgi:rhamnosyltransferase subunit B